MCRRATCRLAQNGGHSERSIAEKKDCLLATQGALWTESTKDEWHPLKSAGTQSQSITRGGKSSPESQSYSIPAAAEWRCSAGKHFVFAGVSCSSASLKLWSEGSTLDNNKFRLLKCLCSKNLLLKVTFFFLFSHFFWQYICKYFWRAYITGKNWS